MQAVPPNAVAGLEAVDQAGVVDMHEDQIDVTQTMVRRLVDDQFPEWRGLPVRQVASNGTVNAIWRLGDDLALRFPLRSADAVAVHTELASEARAARELAAVSPVPTPRPIAIGAPGRGYAMPWAVQTWLPGTIATIDDPAGSVTFARDLAELISCLRAADIGGRRFTGAGRGGNLPDHDEWMDLCFRRSEQLLDVSVLRRLWHELRKLPRCGPDVMSHGDLMPGNVLVDGGRLVGLLDGGGFAPADPALDLVGAWHLLDREPRAQLRKALGCDDVEWSRGTAWALQQAMGLVWYYVQTNPTMSRIGRRTLDRILAEL